MSETTIDATRALADDTDRVVRDLERDDDDGTLTCLTGEPYYRVKEIVLELEAEALAASRTGSRFRSRTGSS